MGQSWSSCRGTAGELVLASRSLVRVLFDHLKTNPWFCFCASCVRPCCRGFITVLFVIFGWPYMCCICFCRIIKFFRNRRRKKISSNDDEAAKENSSLPKDNRRNGSDAIHITENEMARSSGSGKRKHEETCDDTTGNVRKRKSHGDGEAEDGIAKHYAELKNYLFFMNKLRSEPDGDFIDEIHKSWHGDYSQLERHHGYIQWLFPLPERGVNWRAATLEQREIELISSNPLARERLLKSYEVMLDFYGIELVSKETGEVTRAQNWKSRFENLNRNGHNNLRITRILHSVGLLGFKHLQYPLVAFLLREIIVERTLPRCQRSCFDFWMETLSSEQYKCIHEYVEQLNKEASALKKEEPEVKQTTTTRVRRLVRSLTPGETAVSDSTVRNSSEITVVTASSSSSSNTVISSEVKTTANENSESAVTETTAASTTEGTVSESISSSVNAVTANENWSTKNDHDSDGTATESTFDDTSNAAIGGSEWTAVVNTETTVSKNPVSNTNEGAADEDKSTVGGSKQAETTENSKDATESTSSENITSSGSHLVVDYRGSAQQSQSQLNEASAATLSLIKEGSSQKDDHSFAPTLSLIKEGSCQKDEEQTASYPAGVQPIGTTSVSLASNNQKTTDSVTNRESTEATANEVTSCDTSDCQADTECKSDHMTHGTVEDNQPRSEKMHNYQTDIERISDSCAVDVDIQDVNSSQTDTQKQVDHETEKSADNKSVNLAAALRSSASDQVATADEQTCEQTANVQEFTEDFHQEDRTDAVSVDVQVDEEPDTDGVTDTQDNELSGDTVSQAAYRHLASDGQTEVSEQQTTGNVHDAQQHSTDLPASYCEEPTPASTLSQSTQIVGTENFRQQPESENLNTATNESKQAAVSAEPTDTV